MRRRFLLAIGLFALACISTAQPDADAIRAATQRYASRIAAMDNVGVASMFAPDGQMDVPGRQPVRGRAEIARFLHAFREGRVLSEEMTTTAAIISGSAAQSSGTYRQRARLPEGNVVDLQGSYSADWVRTANGVWQIRKIITTPSSK